MIQSKGNGPACQNGKIMDEKKGCHTDGCLVSIIIPVFNEREYLEPCVRSVLNQTYQNIEVILVDDGSTDGTSHDCDEIKKVDKRIQVIHKKNEGLSAARLSGLEQAQGQWMMFVDDDDIVLCDAVESLLFFAANEKIDIIAGGRIDTKTPEKTVCTYCPKKGYDSMERNGPDICSLICTDAQQTVITPMWGKLYRTSFLKQANVTKFRDICPTIFFEDVLMTPLLYWQAKRIVIVKSPFYIHREVPTSISRSGKLSRFYYEQVDAGRILLKFYSRNHMENMYVYELGIYINSILRIYCLIGRGQDNQVEGCDWTKISWKIKNYFQIYRKQYWKYSVDRLPKKLCFLLFGAFPETWRRMARIYYRITKGGK